MMNVDDGSEMTSNNVPAESYDPYFKEENLAAQTRRFIAMSTDIPADAHGALVDILVAYESLLRETKQLLRQADKFNLRHKRANEKLKRQYEELKTTQARLQQAERMASLSLIVAGVAHEVNTPVGISITAASHLQDTSKQFDEMFNAGQMKKTDLRNYISRTKEITELLTTNLQRAAELITSFKQVSVDQTSQKRRVFNLKKTILETLNSLGHLRKSSSRTFDLDCPDAIVMDSFPGALSQVIINLVMNANIHAFDDTGDGHIAITADADTDEVTLKVADNGKGISTGNLKHIFDPFFTTRRGQGGSGLGLHLVFNMVTGPLGGSIEVKSTEGSGTCFTLKLPLVAHDEPEAVTPIHEFQEA
ncbi:HAMP domain-containing sensor histidine kinase [Candidatus Methylospira mobilis]|uniref:sensor histidine kinase n=1 Tax=Candidatus Methylospira mobilis TaxID=1808979 RepID=UPI0028E99D7A|nr:HAMP domain-containing sensor histidine kinase [Candidatus Methylospira mobilis]WNV06719.1 HAMP domain-containing sensor histidine kinase [Candidatus Methylospira mobilis]